MFPQEPLPADHPLWKTPNVILTPHTSGFRQGHWDEVIDLFGDNLDRWLRGEPLKFRIEPDSVISRRDAEAQSSYFNWFTAEAQDLRLHYGFSRFQQYRTASVLLHQTHGRTRFTH